MDLGKNSKMYCSKLNTEAIINSVLCGLACGMLANLILGAIFWFTATENPPLVIGLLAGVFLVVAAGASVLFYSTLFKPTIKKNARRLDGLGLEERAITMVELEGDDSLIATRQREDAIKAIESIDKNAIKIKVPLKRIVSLVVSCVLGISMFVTATLSSMGLMPSGSDFIREILPEEPPIYIPVSYVVEEGGMIDGEHEQLVLMGEDAEAVIAIPDEGYTFEGWDDGHAKPSRQDKKIDHPLIITAIFSPIDGEDGEDPGDEGNQEGEEGESPTEQEGQGSQPGEEGEPGDQEGEDPSEDSGNTGAGKYNKVNQIIDGNTYYRELLDEYKEQIMELLKKNADELTEEEKALIEAYINIV